MSIHKDDLTHHDYMILEYINEHEALSKSDIIEHFLGKIISVDLRINNLTSSGPVINPPTDYIWRVYKEAKPVCGEPSLELTDRYMISPYGQKVLQDYKTRSKLSRRALWLKNCWIPIIVSLATNLAVYLTKSLITKLLPLIQQWLPNIHG